MSVTLIPIKISVLGTVCIGLERVIEELVL